MPAITIHEEPVRSENHSWKPRSLLILINRLSPVSRSPTIRSMISFMLNNSLCNLTEPENPTLRHGERILLRRCSKAVPVYWTVVLLSWSKRENGNEFQDIIGNLSRCYSTWNRINKGTMSKRDSPSLKEVWWISQDRKCRLSVKEIKIKIILDNLSRAMNSFSALVAVVEFYRAQFRIVNIHQN